jgi:hypothetical protein
MRLRDQLPVAVRSEQIHGIGVDRPSCAFRMDRRVSQHVVDRVRCLRSRAKRMCMVAIGEDLPVAAQSAVYRLRDPDRQRLDSAGQRSGIAGLDDEV